MSCVNILDNDTTLLPPGFALAHPCVVASVPNCGTQSTKSASAQSTLVFKPDGTWQVTGAGAGYASCGNTAASPTGVLASGNWITGAFSPSDFEIRFTGTQRYEYDTQPPVGIYSGCSNPEDPIGYDPPYDTGWMQLSAQQSIMSSFNINNGQICLISVNAINAFNVQIRQISNPANSVNGAGSLCARLIQATS